MTAPSPASSSLRYEPSLDGLRALCVLAVFAYHSGFEWARGGFLGVSTFFTLSGFLVTTLLLREAGTNGRIDLARFWRRRMRRLIPASLVALFAIATTAPAWVPDAQIDRLGGDLLACLSYLVNWRFIDEGYAYDLLFTRPSEVQHFWSLAIEGQFYLVFPGVVALFAGRTRGIWWLAAGLAIGTLLSIGLAAWLFDTVGKERVYFGTDTRLAELLVGGLLAVALQLRGERTRARNIGFVGLAALAGLVACWSRVELDTPVLYRGGLALHALGSAGVIAACMAGAGPLRSLLGLAPLRYLGRLSYGAYLFHWPIFMLIEPASLGATATFLLRVGVTIALADLSYRWIELPARSGSSWPTRYSAWASVGGTLLVATVVAIQVPAVREAAMRPFAPGPVRKSVDAQKWRAVGDSTAIHLMTAYSDWSQGQRDVRMVPGMARQGCGLLRSFLLQQGTRSPGLDRAGVLRCTSFFEEVERSTRRLKPDLVVAAFGPFEVRGAPVGDGFRLGQLGEPAVDQALRDALSEFTRILSSGGGHVLWLTIPPLGSKSRSAFSPEQMEAARLRFNEILKQHAAANFEVATVVDMSRYLSERPGGPFTLRPDGAHFTRAGAKELVEEWLGERTLEIARARRQQ